MVSQLVMIDNGNFSFKKIHVFEVFHEQLQNPTFNENTVKNNKYCFFSFHTELWLNGGYFLPTDARSQSIQRSIMEKR